MKKLLAIVLSLALCAAAVSVLAEAKPLAVIAIGKPAESIYLVPATSGDSLTYYRKEGVHYVPKLQVEDLLI